MDTKFSVAVHTLILISESAIPINSEQMAESVGTNASYIRKILVLLKKSEIIEGHRGISGYKLTSAPDQLTLLRIYQAVTEQPRIHLLDVHQNPNDRCVVGRHIRPVLNGIFENLEKSFAQMLDRTTLADCIAKIQKELDHTAQSEI